MERPPGSRHEQATGFASVVHKMLRDVNTAVSIPLVVSRAAKGDYRPLEQAGSGDLDIGDLNLMGSSIWCSEPWVGLAAAGAVGHGLRQLRDDAPGGVPTAVQPGAEARRAALVLDAAHI